MTTADDAESTSGTDTTTGNETTDAGTGAEGGPGAPGADNIAASAAASAPIPPPPPKGAAKKPAAARAPKPKAAPVQAEVANPGPSYQFEPEGGPAVGGSRDLTAAMVEQLATDPLIAVDGERWTDDVGPRGRVISVSRGAEGGPTTTFEETLPLGSTDGLANEARVRLRSRFGS